MSKKLMLLAAGALAVLAFTALPGVASAEEALLKCEPTEAGQPCTYTVAGGESKFSILNGDTVKCASVSGSGKMTGLVNNEATTGEVQLLFHECKEQNTIFHFACTSAGQPSGTITTNNMVTHNIKIPTEAKPDRQGVLITGANTTFTCAGGFASTTVTGNVIGELESPTCNTTGNTLKLTFEATGDGQQTIKSYTGVNYDLEAETNHTSGGSYETAAQTGTGTLTFNQPVVPTC